MILKKTIKFNNKDWLVEIEDGTFKVYLYDNDVITNNYAYCGSAYGQNLIEQCKNIVLRANNILFPVNEFEEFTNWDGDMDKELNVK